MMGSFFKKKTGFGTYFFSAAHLVSFFPFCLGLTYYFP